MAERRHVRHMDPLAFRQAALTTCLRCFGPRGRLNPTRAVHTGLPATVIGAAVPVPRRRQARRWWLRPCKAREIRERSESTAIFPAIRFAWRRESDIEPGWIMEQCHLRNVLDRREVSCNFDGALPHGKRQSLVTRQFHKESTSPKQGLGPFIRHRHAPLPLVHTELACAPTVSRTANRRPSAYLSTTVNGQADRSCRVKRAVARSPLHRLPFG